MPGKSGRPGKPKGKVPAPRDPRSHLERDTYKDTKDKFVMVPVGRKGRSARCKSEDIGFQCQLQADHMEIAGQKKHRHWREVALTTWTDQFSTGSMSKRSLDTDT